MTEFETNEIALLLPREYCQQRTTMEIIDAFCTDDADDLDDLGLEQY